MKEPQQGKFVLVGTPLGNREDLSPRARKAILHADLLLCEDTRSPCRLFGDGVPLPPRLSCFVANEMSRIALLLDRLGQGQCVVFISEAGMPAWSDPGRLLVEAVVKAGFAVDVIPGPTAATTALCLSGFATMDIRFLGFPPRKGSERKRFLQKLAEETATVVLYEAGNRVPMLLQDLSTHVSDPSERRLMIARELTKLHQDVQRGTLATLAELVQTGLQGEVTLVIEGKATASEVDAHAAAQQLWTLLCSDGYKPRDKARAIAAILGKSTSEVYEQLMRLGASKA